ncbi:MAG: TRAM domain-containing protein [Candidatus Micrarchaeaceae archaeon]
MNEVSEDFSEGDLITVNVNAKSPSGEGICRINNFIIFIKNPNTKIGNSYSVKVVRKYRTFAYAELVDVNSVKSMYEL